MTSLRRARCRSSWTTSRIARTRSTRPPHLPSIIPIDFTDDRYTDDCHHRGGLLRMYYDIGWYGTRMIAWGAMPPDPEWSLDDWATVWERHIADNEPYLLKW